MAQRTAPTDAQKDLVMAVAARGNPRDFALLALGFNTGLRSRELSSLLVGHVCDGLHVRPTLRIERARLKGGRGKNRRAITSREIPINEEAATALEGYLAERRFHAPLDLRAPLFLSREGCQAVTTRQVNRIVHRAFREAGLEGQGYWGAHSLRRYTARTVYRLSGNSIMAVKYALGHAHVTTTEAYLGDDGSAAAAIRAMGARVGEMQGMSRFVG